MPTNPFEDDLDASSTCGSSSLSVTTEEGSNEPSPSGVTKNSPSAVEQGVSPTQQSFRFQDLYKLLAKKKNNNNCTDTDSQTTTADASSSPPLLEDVDHVLAGMESPEQARDLLRGIVADLLRENDSLKDTLAEKTKVIETTEKERDIIKDEYRDRLISLKKTVERSIGGACGFAVTPRSSSTEAVISPEEATNMVIQSLSNKVEQLSVEKETLEQELAQKVERMEDLESINETRLYKIEALEAQFQQINKTRLSDGPSIRASCRRQSTDSPAFEVTLPKRTPSTTPRNTPKMADNNRIVTPGTNDAAATKRPKSKKMTTRSTPRRTLESADVNNIIEVGPGMGEI